VIWGGGVLLLAVAVIVAGLVGRARLRSKRDAFAAEIERDVVEAGAGVPVRVTVPDLVLLPGFSLTHSMRLQWRDRVCAGTVPVRPGTIERWNLTTDDRGDFRSPGSTLALRDVFGFTVSRLTESRPERLLVVPTDPGEDVVLPARRGGEVASERTQARVRSEELREVRPYTPGDDMRLLSWKHLATYQELLVRVGELIPPTRGRVEVRIDAYLPSGASPPEVGDALMRALRAIARQASQARVELVCRFPTRRDPVRLSEGGLLGLGGDPDRLAAASAIAGFLPGAAPAPGSRSRPTNASSLLLTARPRLARETGAVLSVSHLIEIERQDLRRDRRPGRGVASLFLREAP